MSWYYHDQEEGRIIAVTPRVASTSQRRWYDSQPKRYRRIDESQAVAWYNDGMPVLATIRNPLERTKSAYRRHKPGFLPIPFEEYVLNRSSWDAHVMPQTQVHAKHGIRPTEWQLFEDLIQELPKHENATPLEHKQAYRTLISGKFQQWFDRMYQEDLHLYLRLRGSSHG